MVIKYCGKEFTCQRGVFDDVVVVFCFFEKIIILINSYYSNCR